MIALNRAGNQVNLLFTCRVDDEVNEPSLNLRPLITHLVRQAMGVFLECLVQHADDEKTPLTPRCNLGELLENIDIRAVLRGGLQELAHLINKQD